MFMTARKKAWLLRVALVDLGLWVARSDGEVSRPEAARILHLLHQWGTTQDEMRRLKRLGEERVRAAGLPDGSLRRLPNILRAEQRPGFLEALAEVAFHEQEPNASKLGRLLDVSRALGIDQVTGLRVARQVMEREEARKQKASAPPEPSPELRPALADLGLEDADPAAARAALRRKTLLYHPDRHPGASAAEREVLLHKLLRVREAYELVLATARPARGELRAA